MRLKLVFFFLLMEMIVSTIKGTNLLPRIKIDKIQAGETPLHRATNEAEIKMLILAGIDPCAVTESTGETALHYIARHCTLEETIVLIRAFIESIKTFTRGEKTISRLLSQSDREGYALVDILFEDHFNIECMQLLLSNGADSTWLHPINGSRLIDRILGALIQQDSEKKKTDLFQALNIVLDNTPRQATKRELECQLRKFNMHQTANH